VGSTRASLVAAPKCNTSERQPVMIVNRQKMRTGSKNYIRPLTCCRKFSSG